MYQFEFIKKNIVYKYSKEATRGDVTLYLYSLRNYNNNSKRLSVIFFFDRLICQAVLQVPLVTNVQIDVIVTMDTRVQTTMIFVQMDVWMDIMVPNAIYLVSGISIRQSRCDLTNLIGKDDDK